MRSIEDMVGDGPEAREFWDDCMTAFGDPAGQRLLARLCAMAGPMGTPLRRTPEETHVCIGRQEIVAALWRRSQPAIHPEDAAPKCQ